MVREYCGKLPQAIDDLERLLNKNRIFIERTRGVGYISAEDAINWGLTGPLARAAGVRRHVAADRAGAAAGRVRGVMITGPGQCPIAENAFKSIISLPMFPGMSDCDEETVAALVKDFFAA